jgi:hypothetical protein
MAQITMPGHTKRFLFEPAAPQDGAAILAILEDAPFHGNISLLYTRRPDAYRSFKQEAPEVDLIVARDRDTGQIAGFGACAIRELFVNGAPARVGYLFGLRMARGYRGKFPILHRGYAYLQALHREKHISGYITTILAENRPVQQLLEKKRSFMPTYQPFGTYKIFALRRRRRTSGRGAAGGFRPATEDDLPRVVEFLQTRGRQYQFFPVLTAEMLQGGEFPGLGLDDVYLLCGRNDEILAAGALWDQRVYKQYVVQGYQGAFKWLAPVTHLLPLLGYPALPGPGSILAFRTLSFWAVRANRPDALQRFLDGVAGAAGDAAFFLVGVHDQHPLHPELSKRPHISYRSKVYLVSWDDQQPWTDALDLTMTPYIEGGLL